MEDGDISLEKEIEELTLDRPPGSILVFGGTETVVEDIFKDVPKTDIDCETIISSRLATCLIDKPLSCQAQDQDVTFDPLSSSERNYADTKGRNSVSDDALQSSPGHALEDSPKNEINILHSSDIEQIHVLSSSIHLVQSQSSESKSTCPNKCTSNKAKLVSCLRGDENAASTADDYCSRCVRFSDGPGIVTEYIEPVNPWRDMRTPSKGEVISIYKNVCKKMKCKPLDKVVKQIQEAPDLSMRSGTLILRGCRLDNKSCEALESVFKRVQFENLDLENCSLEEDGATAILEMIEFYHSTCKLNIACNPKVGLRGWQALCRMLRKTPCLTYLDARRTILTEMTMPTFGRCLKADPYLKVLHLEGVFLSGRPLLILTTALKYNRLLEELYLGDNDLTSNDGPSLGAMLTYNTTLQLLDLRNNQIKDIGLAHIGNGLSDQTEQPSGGLCSLIMWNNGLTHEGMSYLCEGLVKTSTLKALNLGQNRIGDLGVQKLKGGLMKNKSLRKLGFLNTKLGSEGAVALAEVLADSWSITRIDIRENNIQTAGLMAFAMALKVNQSLLRLDLDKDIRKEPGMETVMQSVLVDIYNLCHRNKNLLRKNMTPSQSASSSCSIGTVVSRQSSTSSEMNEPFSYDDVFHPEAVSSEVTPFSPTVCIDSPLDVNAGIMFSSINNIVSKDEIDTSDSTESLGNSVSEAFDVVKRGRAYSDPVKNNPDPAPNGRRASRFSVTKILDSLGTHAQGVASKFAQMDNKLKKHNSKEKIEVLKTSELVPVLDQNQSVEMENLKPIHADDKSNTNAVSSHGSIEEKSGTNVLSTHGDTTTDPTNNADTISAEDHPNADSLNTAKPSTVDEITSNEPDIDKIMTDGPTNTIVVQPNADTRSTDVSSNSDAISYDEQPNTDTIITELTNNDNKITDESIDTISTVDPLSIDTISTVDPLGLDTISTVHPLNTDTISTVHPLSIDTVHPLSTDTISTVHPLSTDTISTVHPLSTDTISIVHPLSIDTISIVHPLSTDTISTVHPLSIDTISTVHPLNTDTNSTVHPLSIDTISTNHPLSTGTISTVHPLSTAKISTVHPLSTDTIGTVHPLSTDTISTVHPLSSNDDNVEVILAYDANTEGCIQQTHIFDTYTYKIEDCNNENFDKKVEDVTSTLDDNNGTNLTSNYDASLCSKHSMNENISDDNSNVFYKEKTIHKNSPSPDSSEISKLSNISQCNSDSSKLTCSNVKSCDMPDKGSMENLLIDDNVEENSGTMATLMTCISGTTTTIGDVTTVHRCIDDKFEDIQKRTEVSEGIESNLRDPQRDYHEECSWGDFSKQLTGIKLNENYNISEETTLLDSVVKIEDFISVHHGIDEGHHGNVGIGGGKELSDTVTVGDGPCSIDVGNKCKETAVECNQGDTAVDCLLDADAEEQEMENLVNLQLEIPPVISMAINDNLAFEYEGKSQGHLSDVESIGMFSQHAIFGQPVEVDLPS